MALLTALVFEVMKRAAEAAHGQLREGAPTREALNDVTKKISDSKLGENSGEWFRNNFDKIREAVRKHQEERQRQLDRRSDSGTSELQQAGAAKRAQSYKDIDAYQQKNEQLRDKARQAGENRRAGGYQAKVTESIGERGATQYVQTQEPDLVMDRGFQQGSGFDQVYTRYDADGNPTEMRIVEAKGPGAELSTGAIKGDQMSQTWTENTVREMMQSDNPDTQALGERLQNALRDGDPPITGQVLQIQPNGLTSVIPGTQGTLYRYN